MSLDFVEQVGGEGVEHLLECFVGQESGLGVREGAFGFLVETGKEGDAVQDGVEVEDTGVEAVFEVGGEVGDFVGKVD